MMSGKCCSICSVSCILLMVGALNWGLVGIGYFAGGNWNVVNMLLGTWPMVENIVYIVVGLSVIPKLMCPCKKCAK